MEGPHGTVQLSFLVTKSGVITDIKSQNASVELTEKARKILLEGPRWIPGREHGYEPFDGEGFIDVSL